MFEGTPIDAATDDFISAILKSDIYITYAMQRDKLKQQPEIREQVVKFREENYRLQKTLDGDELLNALDELQEKYDNLRSMTLVEDFLAAELAFCRMMQEVNTKITEAIDFD